MLLKLAKCIGLKTSLFFPFASLFSNMGLFAHKNDKESLEVMAHFLPPEPILLLLEARPEIYEQYKKAWPQSKIIDSLEGYLRVGRKVDFVWADGVVYEYLLKNATVLFTSSLVEPKDFVLCTQWKQGNFFLKKEIYDGFVNSIQFNPEMNPLPVATFAVPSIQDHLQFIQNKPTAISIAPIDYIYMISLDQRPEKFAASSMQLQQYGLVPFRFSAINGWDLSVQTLNRLGVKLLDPIANKIFMGKVYREIDGIEHKNIEFITDPDLTYFCTGITRGAIGCLLSHLSVLQDAYRSNYQTIWVMEDDIQVLDDLRQLSSLIVELDQIDPDWDILFTDPDSKDPSGNPVPCRALAMRPDLTILPLSHYLRASYPITQNISRIGIRYGSYSMILRRSGIKKILDYYSQHAIFLPYDCDYWLIPSIRMYGLNHSLVTVDHTLPSDNH